MASDFRFCHFYLPHATKSDLSSKTILTETLSNIGFNMILGPEEILPAVSCSKAHKKTGDQRHAVVLIWAHTFPSPKFLSSWTSRIPAGTQLIFNHLPRRFGARLSLFSHFFSVFYDRLHSSHKTSIFLSKTRSPHNFHCIYL